MLLSGRLPQAALATRSLTPLERARVAFAALTPGDRAEFIALLRLAPAPRTKPSAAVTCIESALRWCEVHRWPLDTLRARRRTPRIHTARVALVRYLRDEGYTVEAIAKLIDRSSHATGYLLSAGRGSEGVT